MRRRLLLFGFGVFIGISFLLIGSGNKFSDTFLAYVDYFNPEKRVIRKFILADVQDYTDIKKKLEVSDFLKKAWVNHEMTKKDVYPQIFVLDNIINNEGWRLHCHFYDMERRKVNDKYERYSKVEFIMIEKGIPVSSRSYDSYFYLIGIFLLIMIPVFIFARRLFLRLNNENN